MPNEKKKFRLSYFLFKKICFMFFSRPNNPFFFIRGIIENVSFHSTNAVPSPPSTAIHRRRRRHVCVQLISYVYNQRIAFIIFIWMLSLIQLSQRVSIGIRRRTLCREKIYHGVLSCWSRTLLVTHTFLRTYSFTHELVFKNYTDYPYAQEWMRETKKLN